MLTRLPVFLLGFYVLLGSGCFGPRLPEADDRFLNLDPSVQYVGNASCATCHEDLATSYQNHEMAHSFFRMEPDRQIETFPGDVVADSANGYFYRAVRRGDEYLQIEVQVDDEGREIHRLERPMTFVMGGSAARTYMAESEGRLYELPLTFYIQRNAWDLSPGYEVVNARFDREVPDRCMACHNGVSEPVPFAEGKYTSLGAGIECEQCHGPGALHVEARELEEEAPDSIDVTIVNPAYLSLDLRLDVCQQCHLSGPVSMLREGEDAFSYRPARPLSAHRSVYSVKSSDPNSIGVVSHATRMMASECFIQSSAMDCVTCHDPHDGFREDGPEYFNSTCRTCHEIGALSESFATPSTKASHTVEANCVACHMPKVQASDVIHAAFTDHKIRVVDTTASAATDTEGSKDLIPFFDIDTGNDILEGMAYIVYARRIGPSGVNDRQRGIDILNAALEKEPESGEAQFLLGYALYQSGKAREAVGPLKEAVKLGENPERLNALAQAYEATGKPSADAEALYRRALEIQPAAASIRVNLARLLETKSQFPAAVAEYRRAIDEEPWLTQGHVLLGGALAKAGDFPDAIAALREAVTLNPRHADALTNLGVLMAQEGNVREGGLLFERAVRSDPTNANALANLALFSVNEGRPNEALRLAEQALQRNPQQVTALQVMEVLRRSMQTR